MWGNNEDFQQQQAKERLKLRWTEEEKKLLESQRAMLNKAELLSGFEPTVPYELTYFDRALLLAAGIYPESHFHAIQKRGSAQETLRHSSEDSGGVGETHTEDDDAA